MKIGFVLYRVKKLETSKWKFGIMTHNRFNEIYYDITDSYRLDIVSITLFEVWKTKYDSTLPF